MEIIKPELIAHHIAHFNSDRILKVSKICIFLIGFIIGWLGAFVAVLIMGL